MDKKRRKKKKRGFAWLLGVLVVLILILLLVIGLIVYKKSDKRGENDNINIDQTEKQDEELVFPYRLDDGKLEVESVFRYSGINPDCEDEEGEDIGAVQIKNCSEEYLESAEFAITTRDGTKLIFTITDLPAGSIVMAFEVENKEFSAGQTVEKIEANTSYSSDASMHKETVEIFGDDSEIGLKNVSAETIQNMTLTYRCILDGVYFGGKSYQKNVEALGAGESITLDASECYLGEASVIKISY